jgi:outer membrane lipoprotein-sorting protein
MNGAMDAPFLTHFQIEFAMKRLMITLSTWGFLAAFALGAWAQDATEVIDKAIKAHGGEAALSKLKIYSWSAKGTISFGGAETSMTATQVSEGLDKVRSTFKSEFGGTPVEAVTVLAGDKGWFHFGDQRGALEGPQLEYTKRQAYLNAVTVTLLPLKSKDFKTTLGGEEKVGDKDAVVVKGTGPDGKEFVLHFDKESGLLLKLTVPGVADFGGGEFTHSITFSDYKEIAGIKKAMKSDATRDGQKFASQELTEFKVLDKVEEGTFDEPK